MKKWPVFLLLILAAACTQRKETYILSGMVKDPNTGKGIPKVYVAFQGLYATGFMGGTEYSDDLLLDSTDVNGGYRLEVPGAVIDSFIAKEGGPVSVYRFALDVRCSRSKEWLAPYENYNIFSRLLPIDSVSFNDRNYLNRRTYVLTEKNRSIQHDITGMSVPFYQGGALRISIPAKDTDYIRKALVAVDIRELSAANGRVPGEEELFFSPQDLKKAILVKARMPMKVTLCKYDRESRRRDTLTVLNGVRVDPGEERVVALE